MKHVVPFSSFETAMMDVEEQSFTWTIENFFVIRQKKPKMDPQKIYFTAGSTVGRPSKWTVVLEERMTTDGEKWFSIHFNVMEPPVSNSTWKNVFAEMSFLVDHDGFVRFDKNTGPEEVAILPKYGRGYNQCVSGKTARRRLVIKHTFKLYVPSKDRMYIIPIPSKSTEECQPTIEALQLKSTESPPPTVKELQVKFATQAKNDLLALWLKNPSPGKNVKLISNDNKEFFIQMPILEMQSSVLTALTAMMKIYKLEANSEGIKFPDISSKGLEVILAFLSTGEFHPDWSHPKVVVELTYAAANYQLQDLLKFLDATLGTVCKTENALALFTLAHKYSLKKAEVELLEFIHVKGSSSPEAYSKILNGISVPTCSAFVVFPPPSPPTPQKSRWTLIQPFWGLFAKDGKKTGKFQYK